MTAVFVLSLVVAVICSCVSSYLAHSELNKLKEELVGMKYDIARQGMEISILKARSK